MNADEPQAIAIRSLALTAGVGVAAGASVVLTAVMSENRVLPGVAGLLGCAAVFGTMCTLSRRFVPVPADTPRDARTQLKQRFDSAMDDFLAQERKVESQRRRMNGAVRQRTAELMIANRELERRDRLRDEFISLLAHEFRTPLTSVRSYVEMLVRYGADIDAEERQQSLEIVSDQVRRLSCLITDLLHLSRLRTGRLELCVEEVALSELLDELRESTSGLGELAGKRVVLTSVDSAAAAAVQCDRERLLEILMKLIGNSIKYTPDDALIEVRCQVAANTVTFEVSDNGPGIPTEDHDLVFEPFYRTRAVGQSDQEGTGLGLYLCREFTRRMDGTLKLETSDTGGARFTLRLPRPSGDAARHEAAQRATAEKKPA